MVGIAWAALSHRRRVRPPIALSSRGRVPMESVMVNAPTPTVRPAQVSAHRPDAPATRVARALCLLVATIPLAVGWVLWAAPGAADDYNRRVTFAPFDFVVIAMLAFWIRGFVGTRIARPSRSVGSLLAVAFVLVYLVSFSAHPSWRGLDYALRLLGGVAIADLVRRLDVDALRRLCTTLTAVGAVESLLAIAQSVRGQGFALYPFDQAGPLFAFGDTHAGRGGLSHPYHLAVFLLLSAFAAIVGGRHSEHIERRVWMIAIAVIGAGLAVTFSRSVVLALAPTTVVWCMAHRENIGRAVRPLMAALLIGLIATGAIFASGWTTRAQQSTNTSADRGRVALAQAGLRLAADAPFTGVGPARYVIALAEPGAPDGELLPSHNLVVQAAAELGVFGAVIVGALALWFARRVTRRGALVIGGAWLLVPFVLLDSYPYVFPTGLAIASLWIGLVGHRDMRSLT